MKLKFYPTILLVTALSFSQIQAQTICSGEVILNRETFGTGTSNASLPSGRTNYSYNSSTLKSDEYKLSNDSKGRPEWHSVGDHTGDVNGRMMEINASYAAGEFYKDTISSLVSGRNYSLYMYVMNVSTSGTCGTSAILPKVLIEIEYLRNGFYTRLASGSSDNLPQTASAVWVKTGVSFILPTGITSVRYRIINNSTGGCGNDLALDDITFSQCAAQASLPITGLNINLEQKDNKAIIHFITESEFNSRNFITEKSYDAKSWSSIHEQAAAGNSNDKRYYSTTDADINSKVIYYRIKQSDIDGRFTYSPVVVFKLNEVATTKATTYPNPFNSSFSIEYKSISNETLSVSLMDVSGRSTQRVTWNIHAGTNIIQMENTNKLIPGYYILEARDKAGRIVFTDKVIKK